MPSNDPEYQKRYIREHYQKNKDYYKAKAKKRRQDYISRYGPILKRYKTIKGCVDCGYRESPHALDFDHVRGDKSCNVSSMVGAQRPWPIIKEEVFKCEVRCANCHRVVTAERAGY